MNGEKSPKVCLRAAGDAWIYFGRRQNKKRCVVLKIGRRRCRRLSLVCLAASVSMPETDPCEVYMRYLPRSCTEADLREKFEKCGRIKKVWLSVDRASGECKGFGFVTFSSKTEARRCVKDYNEHPRNYMDGKHVVITHAKGWDDGAQARRAVLVRDGVSPRRLLLLAPQKLGPQGARPPVPGAEDADADDATAGEDESNGANARVKRTRDENEAEGEASGKKPRVYKERKKTASRRHKLGAKARKRAKAREAKEAAGSG
jgi:RNA recognition motif-containing protein